MLWSILICTLESRKQSFSSLYSNLTALIKLHELQSEVEVLYLSDKGEASVGQKRNELVSLSKGEYVCFIDDDDKVSDNYIPLIYKSLVSYPDCVGLTGVITFNGKNPKRFIHSIKYNSYFEKGGVYYRPPNHLNPIRKEIAQHFLFPSKYFGEDTDWALRICKAGVLKKECFISDPLYYYLFTPKSYKNR